MKLTLPALRTPEPAAHQGVSEHTGELLDEIDALLAESLTARMGRRLGPARSRPACPSSPAAA